MCDGIEGASKILLARRRMNRRRVTAVAVRNLLDMIISLYPKETGSQGKRMR